MTTRPTRLLKVVGDETRARILERLAASGELCVGALARQLGLTSSAVSQHLRLLRQAGLVRANRRGCWVHYSLDGPRLARLATQVGRWLGGLGAVEGQQRCTPCVRATRTGPRRES